MSQKIRLSFDKELFKKEYFDCNEFLEKHEKNVNMETLQNDLALYSKEISSTIYELIYENYSDFIDFNTKLSNFESLYENFNLPLLALNQEIKLINCKLEDCINKNQNIIKKIEIANTEREKNYKISYLEDNLHKVIEQLNENRIKVEFYCDMNFSLFMNSHKILENLIYNYEISAIAYNYFLRTVVQYKLNGYNEKLDDLLSRILSQCETLFNAYINLILTFESRNSFLLTPNKLQICYNNDTIASSENINKNDDFIVNIVKSLTYLLNVYALLNKCFEAELIVQAMVHKLFDKIVVSEYLTHFSLDHKIGDHADRSKYCLSQIYNLLVSCIEDKLTLFLPSKNQNKYAILFEVKNFNFLKNSIWAEIVDMFGQRFKGSPNHNIYSCLNPNNFFENYSLTIKFVENIESRFTSKEQIIEFRKSPLFARFMVKPWNLEIYYQKRFQEIAGHLERCLLQNAWNEAETIEELKTYQNGMENLQLYHLQCTRILRDSLIKVWDERQNYLSTCAQKFWKLSLQLLSRYVFWIKEEYIPNMEQFDDWCSRTLLLLVDLNTLKTDLPTLYDNYINSKITHVMQHSPVQLTRFKDAFCQTNDEIENELIPLLETRIVKNLLLIPLQESHLKKMFDIPKIYRHTKRTPNNPSPYVSDLVSSLERFYTHDIGTNLFPKLNSQGPSHTTILNQIYLLALDELNSKFAEMVRELLTNVQRTEESLMRLKRVKGLVATNETFDNKRTDETTSTNTAFEISDEFKIKKQIAIDVNAYQNLVNGLPALKDVLPIDTYFDAFKNLNLPAV